MNKRVKQFYPIFFLRLDMYFQFYNDELLNSCPCEIQIFHSFILHEPQSSLCKSMIRNLQQPISSATEFVGIIRFNASVGTLHARVKIVFTVICWAMKPHIHGWLCDGSGRE